MKLLTKYTVIALLSAGLMLATPVRSHAFLGALVDVFNGVKKGIEYAAKITKWTQLSAEVFSYPNEYIREVNNIRDEIEVLKRMAAEARLSVHDMNQFLQLAKLYGNSLEDSLNEFSKIIDIINEGLMMFATSSGESTDPGALMEAVKARHQKNMKALAGARRIVNNSKALIASSHAANSVVGASKKLK